VADTGPGIAEDDKGRIFTAFKRLEGSQRQVGSGLGLHITLQLVKLLGGSIGLDSEIGRGTKFHVRLPYQDAPVETSAAASEPAAATTGQHLLLAEDDPDLVQLLQLYLARAGYVLTIVDNGRDAVSEALARQPDLVLMDFNLPIVDGLSAACQLREKGYSGVVVALTGATLDDDRLQAVEAGFDGFIAKPIRMPELMATLQALLA
ncbi:MAG: response regulator, partial [Gammaproteobacteria bacterium]|nr:response regulator [Gammaproteobacteria bacterium]